MFGVTKLVLQAATSVVICALQILLCCLKRHIMFLSHQPCKDNCHKLHLVSHWLVFDLSVETSRVAYMATTDGHQATGFQHHVTPAQYAHSCY
jgi:hypothetical protein